jgi:flagellar basal-body rod modification protein FlgD
MTTTNATTSTSGTSGSSSTPPVNPKSVLGKDDFLKLMVAQLKYQNPLSPSDQSQMTSQMAQFSMVEGINNLEASVDQLNSGDTVSQAVSLIGKQVTYVTDDGTNATGKATSASFSNGQATVHVGDTDVALANVLEVADA